MVDHWTSRRTPMVRKTKRCVCQICAFNKGQSTVGHTPSTVGTFRKKFRKNSGKTSETLSEPFLEFRLRVRLESPKPYNSRHLRLPELFQNYLPLSTAGDACFLSEPLFRGEGLSELVMEFWVHVYGVVRQHSVLRRVLRRFWGGFWGRGSQKGSEKGGLLWVLQSKRVLRRVLRRGSEKAISRRCLERPLEECAPLGVRPIASFEVFWKNQP